MNKPIYIDRPPRIQPELPSEQIEIPSPPEKQDEGNSKLIQVAPPLADDPDGPLGGRLHRLLRLHLL
jgi:hypothetical protein